MIMKHYTGVQLILFCFIFSFIITNFEGTKQDF